MIEESIWRTMQTETNSRVHKVVEGWSNLRMMTQDNTVNWTFRLYWESILKECKVETISDLFIQMDCIELSTKFSIEYVVLSINWMRGSQFFAVKTICLLTLCWPSRNELSEVIRWSLTTWKCTCQLDNQLDIAYPQWSQLRQRWPITIFEKIRLSRGILAKFFPIWFLNWLTFILMNLKLCNYIKSIT